MRANFIESAKNNRDDFLASEEVYSLVSWRAKETLTGHCDLMQFIAKSLHRSVVMLIRFIFLLPVRRCVGVVKPFCVSQNYNAKFSYESNLIVLKIWVFLMVT